MIRIPRVPIFEDFHRRKPWQIVRDPIGLDWKTQLEFWDWQFRKVWEAGDTILYVDEATLVTPPRALIPQYSACVKTGRERDVAVWTGSQRPKEIPSAIFTESEHFFVFRLNWDADRQKVASFTADRMMEACSALMLGGERHKHDFVYYNVGNDRLIRRVPPKPIAEPAPAQTASP